MFFHPCILPVVSLFFQPFAMEKKQRVSWPPNKASKLGMEDSWGVRLAKTLGSKGQESLAHQILNKKMKKKKHITLTIKS